MSKFVKLAAKLPGDELVNGLDAVAADLVDRWKERDPQNPASLLVVGVVRCRDFRTTDVGDGVVEIPTVEFVRLEPLGFLGQEGVAHMPVAAIEHQKILLGAAERRTGATPLPIDAESSPDGGNVVHVDFDEE